MEGLVTERNAMPARGPRFFKGDSDEIMFEFVIDAGNIIGPRLALKADSEKHPEAWATFAAAPDEPDVVEVPPPTLTAEEKPPAEPETVVEEKDMSGFEARLEPAPEKPKRKYTRRKAA